MLGRTKKAAEHMPYPDNYADYDIDECDDSIGLSCDPACVAGRHVSLKVTITLAEELTAGQGLAVFALSGGRPKDAILRLPLPPPRAIPRSRPRAALRFG